MGMTICKMIYISEFNGKISTAKYLRYNSYCKNEINNDLEAHFILYTATIIKDSNTLILGISMNNSLILDGVTLVQDRELNCNSPVLYNQFYWYIFALQENIDLPKSINRLKFNVKAMYKCINVEFNLNLDECPFNVNLENLEKYSEKAWAIYSMNLDILYVHALFFRYILQDASKFSESIKKSCEQVKASFNKLNSLLKKVKEENDNLEFKKFFKTLQENFELLKSTRNLENNNLDALDSICSNRSIVYMFNELLFDVFYFYLVQVNLLPNNSWSNFKFAENENILTEKIIKNVKNEAEMNYRTGIKDFLSKFEIPNNDHDDVDRTTPLLGLFEKEFKDRLESDSLDFNKISNDGIIDEKSLNFLKSVMINFELRETLVNTCLIGVFGLKSAGKSSFIKCLLNNNNNNIKCEIKETKEMSAYQLSDKIDLILVDYPPCNLTDKYNNIQFDNSVNMLDYAFLVCDTKDPGETLTTSLADAIHSVKVFGVKRLCVFVNKIDKVVKDEKNLNMKIYLKNIKENILNNLTDLYDKKYNYYLDIYKNDKRPELEIILKLYEFNRDEYEKHLKIIPTCYNPNVCNNEDEIKELKSFGVLFGDSLKRKIAHFILDCIENKGIKDQLRNNILSETRINKKECTFQRVKFYPKQTNFVDLTLSKSVNEGNIHNKNDLENNLKETFSLKSIQFDTEIDSFEKFFIVDDCTFYIEDNGFVSCLF